MRVLGIDPGTGRCGFGVVEKHGTTITPVNYGVIETYKDQSDLERLNIVYEGIAELIATYRPAFMGVETLYFNTNITTGIKVAQARGVILLAGYRQNVPIIPVTPLQVKQQLTGYGRADKKQVIEMVKRMMHITKKIDPDDAAQAINRDVLVPRKGGRFTFGRLIDRQAGRVGLLPPGAGQRQIVIDSPPWLAVAEMLVRKL